MQGTRPLPLALVHERGRAAAGGEEQSPICCAMPVPLGEWTARYQARVRFCSDPDCEGHRCENGVYDPQQDDGDESADEDSCSEHSSSTSTSTNQKEGKYCDCCYCEFFGHGGVSARGLM